MKKNILYSLICGELSSWFLIFIIKNPYIKEFEEIPAIENLIWFLPIALPIIFLLGILVGQVISKFIRVISEIIKFIEIGVLNTFIDMGILNVLVWLTGITSGAWVILMNSLSFFCATTNSYYWNKFWTFKKEGQRKEKEFLQFLVVSVIGWGINTGIVFSGTTLISPMANLSAGAWVNIMKIVATLIAMVWNFLGYKFIVFKS